MPLNKGSFTITLGQQKSVNTVKINWKNIPGFILKTRKTSEVVVNRFTSFLLCFISYTKVVQKISMTNKSSTQLISSTEITENSTLIQP